MSETFPKDFSDGLELEVHEEEEVQVPAHSPPQRQRSLEAAMATRIRDHQDRVRNKKVPKNRIRQHIPSCVSVDSAPLTAEFRSVAELLEIPWVAQWRSDLDAKKFHRFSLSDGDKLMAEYDRGYHWWVVGFVDTPVSDLPVWKAKYRGKKKSAAAE